jgi:hypothetical protein
VNDLTERMREVENRIIAISGLDGSNGKLGMLAKAVADDRKSRQGWMLALAGVAVPALIAGASALYITGTRDGDEARLIETLRADVARLQAEANDTGSTLGSLRIELATLRAMTLAPRRGGKP